MDEDEEQEQPVVQRRAASRPGARFRRGNPPALPGASAAGPCARGIRTECMQCHIDGTSRHGMRATQPPRMSSTNRWSWVLVHSSKHIRLCARRLL